MLLLGVPGAGKTTLLRQLIGCHPEHDRFPSTSVNRTTTCPIEIITRDGGFSAVVTFLSEHESRFEVEECVSGAILKAVDGDRRKTARVFLEPSDMRVRLKYLLGDYIDDSEAEEDPYAEDYGSDDLREDSSSVSATDASELRDSLDAFLDRIVAIADRYHKKVVEQHGPLEFMKPEDKSSAMDLIQEEAERSDEYVELVSEILDEIRTKFKVELGKYEKSTTGWPLAWRIVCAKDEREQFFKAVRFFSGISIKSWGTLLTPLVNGIRVAGPLFPTWTDRQVRLVVMDTEGLSHKANATADLPEHVIALFDEADCIALVDSAKNAMTHFATGKALEAVVSSGQTRKLVVAFTHMDVVSGENLRGKARFDHVFAGLRNVVENQVAKTVSIDLARYLLTHLEENTFFLGRLDQTDASPAHKELQRLLRRLESSTSIHSLPVAFPEYSTDKLVLAIQEAAQGFRKPWRAGLGLEPIAGIQPCPWQSIKAMSRRYAEGWDDGYRLRPASNLLNALMLAFSRFLDAPMNWSGNPTEEQKREVIDSIKKIVTQKSRAISNRRLREKPQPEWQSAYAHRGDGSTFQRKMQVEEIYERWVPIPHSGSDSETQKFLDEMKNIVLEAIQVVQDQIKSELSIAK